MNTNRNIKTVLKQTISFPYLSLILFSVSAMFVTKPTGAQTPDVAVGFVAQEQFYWQEGFTYTPELDTYESGGSFSAIFPTAVTAVNDAAIWFPGDVSGRPFFNEGDGFFYETEETATGTFQIDIDGANQGPQSIMLNLDVPQDGYGFPDPLQILSIEEDDVNSELTINWSAWTGTKPPGPDDLIIVLIEGPDEDLFRSPISTLEGTPLSGTETSITVAYEDINDFEAIAGRTVEIYVMQFHLVDTDDTYGTASMAAAWAVETGIEYTFSGTASGPWWTDLGLEAFHDDGTLTDSGGAYEGEVSFPLNTSYQLFFESGGDPNFPGYLDVLFTDPPERADFNAEQASWYNTWHEGSTTVNQYWSNSKPTGPSNYPDGGNYMVTYGQSMDTYNFYLDDPMLATRQIAIVPTISHADGYLQTISWSYFDINGNPVSPTTVASWAFEMYIWLGLDQWGESINELSPMQTSVDISDFSIPKDDLQHISLNISDDNGLQMRSSYQIQPQDFDGWLTLELFPFQDAPMSEVTEGVSSGQVSFPLDAAYYQLNFNVNTNYYYLENPEYVMFTDPLESPFMMTSAVSYENWDNEYSSYYSPTADITASHYPSNGYYEILFGEAGYSTWYLGVDRNNFHVIVPQASLDQSGRLTSIAYGFYDENGNEILSPAFLQYTSIDIINKNNQSVYSQWNEQSNPIDLSSHGIDWDQVHKIAFRSTDSNGNETISDFVVNPLNPFNDVDWFEIVKEKFYIQTDESTVSWQDFGIWAEVTMNSNDPENWGLLNYTDSNPVGLLNGGDMLWYYDYSSTEDYPDDTYTLSVSTVNDGFQQYSLNIFPDSTIRYPAPPMLTNYGEAQAIDPSTDFTLTWNEFADRTQNDYIYLEIYDNYENLVHDEWIDPAYTSTSIPANTLSEEETYHLYLYFVNGTQSTQFTGNNGTIWGGSGFSSTVDIEINTFSIPDIDGLYVVKEQFYFQSGSGVTVGNYGLFVDVFMNPHAEDVVNAGQFTYAEGPYIPLANDGWALSFEDEQSSEIYPDSTYTIMVSTINDGYQQFDLDLYQDAGVRYPAQPSLTNYAAAQTIDTSDPAGFDLQWAEFSDRTNGDYIYVDIYDALDNNVFSEWVGDPSATTLNIPYGTLDPDSLYFVEILFLNITDSVDFAPERGGLYGEAAFSSTLEFEIQTEPVSTIPESFFAYVAKEVEFKQTGTMTVTLVDDYPPYGFSTGAEGDTVVAGTVVLPASAGTVQFYMEDDYLEYYDSSWSQTSLDDNYPDGNFTVYVTHTNDSVESASVNLSLGDYPPAPLISNWNSLYSWKITGDNTLSWNPWSGEHSNDYIQIEVIHEANDGQIISDYMSPEPLEPGAITGDQTSHAIPGDNLEVGQYYEIIVSFIDVVDDNESANGYFVAAKLASTIADAYVIADIKNFWINKNHSYYQNSTADPVEYYDPQYRWEFVADVHASIPGSLVAATIEQTGIPGTLEPLVSEGDDDFLSLEGTFSDQATMDANYPDTAYTLTITTVDDTYTSTLDISETAYPQSLPKFTNYVEAQLFDPTGEFTVYWEAWDYGSENYSSIVNRGIHVSIYEWRTTPDGEDDETIWGSDFGDNPGPLSPDATFYTIPADTLEPGRKYTIGVSFNNFVDEDNGNLDMYGTANFSVSVEMPLLVTDNIVFFAAAVKESNYEQWGPDTLELSREFGDEHGPFGFFAFAEGTNIAGGSVDLPNSLGSVDLVWLGEDEGWEYNQVVSASGYEPQSDFLDTAYPDGTYEITIDFDDESSESKQVDMKADEDFPPAPRISNFEDLMTWQPTVGGLVVQTSDPLPASGSYLLTWDEWKSTPENDFIIINIDGDMGGWSSPEPYSPGALTADATMVEIPAADLVPGVLYSVNITFVEIVDEVPSAGGGIFAAAKVTSTSTGAATSISYTQWADANIVDPVNNGYWYMDPDGDGIRNLDEYMNGTDPMIPNERRRHKPMVENDFFVVRTNLLIGTSAHLYSTWQTSQDLENWSDTQPDEIIYDFDNRDETSIPVELRFAIPPGDEEKFMRLFINTQTLLPPVDVYWDL